MASNSESVSDEPMLPLLPRPDSLGGRKRAHPLSTAHADPPFSSDPGIFSSDDDPALDNYVQGRRKRRYRGTWYHHNHMLSDPSQDEDESRENDGPKSRTLQTESPGSEGEGYDSHGAKSVYADDGHPLPTPPSSNPQSQGLSSELSRKRSAIKQRIEGCIDRGELMIDLMHMDLDDECVSPDTFQPLCNLRLVPRVRAGTVPGPFVAPLMTSEDGYLHRESKIVLMMSNNRLSRVPGMLFSVENLVDLTLWRNELTELPPAIAQCRNLRSLNVACNRLRYLPFELIERLAMLHTLSIAGNDFFIPDIALHPDQPSSFWGIRGNGPPTESDKDRLAVWYVGRGPVQYTDTAGGIYSSFRVPPAGRWWNRIPIQDPSEQPGPLARRQVGESMTHPSSNVPPPLSRVPSLVEFCARSLAKSGWPEEYDDTASEPDILATAIDAAAQARYKGGQFCAICKKPYVIARTQWIEFFIYDPYRDESKITSDWTPEYKTSIAVPCLRSGCSWKCVPYGQELRPCQRLPFKL